MVSRGTAPGWIPPHRRATPEGQDGADRAGARGTAPGSGGSPHPQLAGLPGNRGGEGQRGGPCRPPVAAATDATARCGGLDRGERRAGAAYRASAYAPLGSSRRPRRLPRAGRRDGVRRGGSGPRAAVHHSRGLPRPLLGSRSVRGTSACGEGFGRISQPGRKRGRHRGVKHYFCRLCVGAAAPAKPDRNRKNS